MPAPKNRYKIQGLIEEGFDFNTIFPDKVDYIRNTSGMNFTVQDIVDLMRQETKNFTEDNNIAYDIDDAIAEIAAKYKASTSSTPVPTPGEPSSTEPAPEPSAPTQSKEDLERVLRGVKRMAKEQPDNRALRGRIRFLEEKIKNFGKMAKGGEVGGRIEVVGKGKKGVFRKKEYDGMTESEVINWWQERGYTLSKTKTESKLNKYEFYINTLFTKGGKVSNRKYRLGDGYSSDFDYEGMLKMGLKAKLSWGEKKLRKLYDSFEDVNYHHEIIPLWSALQAIKAGNKSEAKKFIDSLHAQCKETLEHLNEEFLIKDRVSSGEYSGEIVSIEGNTATVLVDTVAGDRIVPVEHRFQLEDLTLLGLFAQGGEVGDLEKELHQLQRALNSSRLQTYIEGDKSEEQQSRFREREVKLARFNEVLKLLREKDALSKGGKVKKGSKKQKPNENNTEL